jgi:intein/homing endonuclease
MATYALSAKQRKAEILRCAKDPSYFINNYVYISHPVRGQIPFKMFEYQEDVLKDLIAHRFNIILKSRQLGMSTLAAGWIMHICLFNKHQKVVVVSQRQRDAADVLKKVKDAYKNLPSWMKITKPEGRASNGVIGSSKKVSFTNGSQVLAEATSGNAARGGAASLLVIDEAAAIDNKQITEMWSSAYPTLSCVTSETLVLTDSGYVRIGEMCEGVTEGKFKDIKRWRVSNGETNEKATKAYVSPKSETRRIETIAGFELEGTLKHPVMVLNGETGGADWKKLSEVEDWDYIPISIGTNVYGKRKVSGETAYELGSLIAKPDGTKGKKVYFKERNVTLRSDGATPKEILQAPKKVIAEYLSALFDQGVVTGQGFFITSKNKQLIKDAQVLLLNMGIYSATNNSEFQKRDAWTLSVPRSYFRELDGAITLRSDWNSSVFEYILSTLGEHKEKKLMIPTWAFLPLLEDIKETNGIDSLWFRENGFKVGFTSSWHKNEFISREWLQDFSDFIEEKELNVSASTINGIDFLLKPFMWSPIKKIEKGEAVTYDLHVPIGNAFLQNNILGHNTGGKCLIISTPRGVGNFYYETWMDAVQGKSDFNPIKLHWSMHPDYDQEWYEKQCRNMPPQQVAQEYDCSFNKSGDTVFDGADIERYEKFVERYANEPVFWAEWCRKVGAYDSSGERCLRQLPEKLHSDRNFYVWEHERPGCSYVIGADVSRGDGQDFSTAMVLKTDTGEFVAEYRGKLHPSDFANLLYDIGMKYGEAMLAVENNNHGHTVLSDLEKLEYPNLYYSFKKDHSYCSPEDALYASGVTAGLTTGRASKQMFVAKAQDYLRKSKVVIYSQRLIDEFNTYIFHASNSSALAVKIGAMKNRNDDLISAMLMAIWARETAFGVAQKEVEYSQAFLKAMSKNNNTINTTIKGMHGYTDRKYDKVLEAKEKSEYDKRKSLYWPSVIKG